MIDAAECLNMCRGHAAEEAMLEASSGIFYHVIGRRASCTVAARLWMNLHLSHRNILGQALDPRVGDAADVPCDSISPSVDGDDLLV